MLHRIEPVLWVLFGAGGMVAAFLVPIHLVVFGLLLPLGVVPVEALDHGSVAALTGHWLGKAYLLVLLTLPLFHWAHRFRFTLVEMKLKRFDPIIATLCYGSAFVLSIAAFWVVLAG